MDYKIILKEEIHVCGLSVKLTTSQKKKLYHHPEICGKSLMVN